MPILQHDFTQTIINILNKYFPGYGDIIVSNSQLALIEMMVEVCDCAERSSIGDHNQ
jgi:hypothetical protein